MPALEIKALILAGGLGTRLLPHTRTVPKPLFPIGGRPILDIIIERLIRAGVSAVAVNVHHLHDRIIDFLASRQYPVPVVCRHEPRLLGTGGAIRNFADFLGERPFIVINGDILTDISIPELVGHHLAHCHPATLVVHDHPAYNKVCIDPKGHIRHFNCHRPDCPGRHRAFTGLQVIDPAIYDYIPAGTPAGSIEAFTAMIQDGHKIKAYEVSGHYWADLGTPASYRRAVIDSLAPPLFEKHFGIRLSTAPACVALAGDGSDRRWFRLRAAGGQSMIVADHGIQSTEKTTEFDSFVRIGRHLHGKSLAVPEIYAHDRFSGLVFVADLGETLLQSVIRAESCRSAVRNHYRAVIDKLLELHDAGAQGFDPEWACQTPAYTRELIIEKEGGYFVNAFLRGWLEMTDGFEETLAGEFARIADTILALGRSGFMHRDMQSRNIMVTPEGYFFIDFQGGRIGPLQYDLASLITDPYVNLDPGLRKALLADAMDRLGIGGTGGRQRFEKCYRYCAIARNMQALGAYGFLAGARGKTGFAAYMEPALDNLCALLESARDPALPNLTRVAARARRMLKTRG